MACTWRADHAQEARQILNVSKEASLEDISKAGRRIACICHVAQTYEKLFALTDKKSGGSFYLQSKARLLCRGAETHTTQVYRAKERIDIDLGQPVRPPVDTPKQPPVD